MDVEIGPAAAAAGGARLAAGHAPTPDSEVTGPRINLYTASESGAIGSFPVMCHREHRCSKCNGMRAGLHLSGRCFLSDQSVLHLPLTAPSCTKVSSDGKSHTVPPPMSRLGDRSSEAKPEAVRLSQESNKGSNGIN